MGRLRAKAADRAKVRPPVREWHVMLDTHLHALGGNGPDGGVEIDLLPLHVDDFARPRGGEDREHER